MLKDENLYLESVVKWEYIKLKLEYKLNCDIIYLIEKGL